MPVYLPNFNLTCRFHFGNDDTHPVYAHPPCQLYFPTKTGPPMFNGVPNEYVQPIFIRYPKGLATPIYLFAISIVGDAPGNYYVTQMWERTHKGFPNEYWTVLVTQMDFRTWSP